MKLGYRYAKKLGLRHFISGIAEYSNLLQHKISIL